MTDFTPEPIIVPATPAKAQVEAGIRQIGAAVAIILTGFGATAMAGKVGIVVSLAPQFAVVLTVLGPVVWGAVTWIGQLATRKHAVQLATIATDPRVPDEVAQIQTKPA